MTVEFVQWPSEMQRRDQLASLGRARLLLVDAKAEPPITSDRLEDWIRIPAPEIDLRARAASLAEAANDRPLPHLEKNGLLYCGEKWTAVPPIEARLVRSLLEGWQSVVTREALTEAGWPDQAPGRNALDVHILRLRRRIDDIGLAIRTVRSQGYVLELAQRRSLHAS